MANEHTILIVGSGVAASVLGYYLRNDLATATARIIKVSQDREYPPCSRSSTSTICLRNARKGVSPLGDLLVSAFQEFHKFEKDHRPAGVYACCHLHLWSLQSERAEAYRRRYFGQFFRGDRFDAFVRPLARPYDMAENRAYVIDPGRYLGFLAEQTRYDEVIEEQVVSVHRDTVTLSSGRTLSFDRLFLCTGQYTHAFADVFQDPHHLKRSKPVAGTYLEFDLGDFRVDELRDRRSAFCLDVEEVNLVFRPESRAVLLGATSKNDCASEAHDPKILEMFEKARHHLAGALTLPPLDRARMVTGIRHKGHRRQPFWGRIAPNTYAVYGLYKNAFMTANLAAKELLRTL